MTSQNNKRRILVVDDNPVITLTVKIGLQASVHLKFIHLMILKSLCQTLSLDCTTWHFLTLECQGCMDHELQDEVKKIDGNLKVCFMTATYQNYEALRAAFPTTEIECYIQKPIEVKDLVRRINAEVEQ
ncbi:hypothetical protein BH18THE2_BH18THE2_17260 [soil metagenome]